MVHRPVMSFGFKESVPPPMLFLAVGSVDITGGDYSIVSEHELLLSYLEQSTF